jgi:hypothetical protein
MWTGRVPDTSSGAPGSAPSATAAASSSLSPWVGPGGGGSGRPGDWDSQKTLVPVQAWTKTTKKRETDGAAAGAGPRCHVGAGASLPPTRPSQGLASRQYRRRRTLIHASRSFCSGVSGSGGGGGGGVAGANGAAGTGGAGRAASAAVGLPGAGSTAVGLAGAAVGLAGATVGLAGAAGGEEVMAARGGSGPGWRACALRVQLRAALSRLQGLDLE